MVGVACGVGVVVQFGEGQVASQQSLCCCASGSGRRWEWQWQEVGVATAWKFLY